MDAISKITELDIKKLQIANLNISVNALVEDIIPYIKARLATGSETFIYDYCWKTQGFFMSPVKQLQTSIGYQNAVDAACSIEQSPYEIRKFLNLVEVKFKSFKTPIYTIESTAKYEHIIDDPNMLYMHFIIKLSLKPPEQVWEGNYGYRN